MKISSFDLNLFVIMNAIYTEGSLTKAAEVVGITQPAVSNALARLRERFNDDLFVRTGTGMVPTHKTEHMINDVQHALSLMQKSVNEPDEFDPETSQRTFRISLGDISEGRILPFLLEKINKTAPKISIESFFTTREDLVHALATNELNFAIDPVIPRSKDVLSKKVFEDRFVCAHRANHPLTKLPNFDMDALLSQKFINISNRKRGPALIDLELSKIQLQREVALRAQHFLVTPEIVRSTDLVLVCSQSFAKKHGLQFEELPLDVPKVEQYLIWHTSDDNDGSHIWMRELITEAFDAAKTS